MLLGTFARSSSSKTVAKTNEVDLMIRCRDMAIGNFVMSSLLYVIFVTPVEFFALVRAAILFTLF